MLFELMNMLPKSRIQTTLQHKKNSGRTVRPVTMPVKAYFWEILVLDAKVQRIFILH